MRVFAYYLPQFHTIPENDEWWGRGFTEWTNVKAAKRLFVGHNQPKVPLNEYYYNLLNKETVEWQNNLRKQYRIDGLIYYHYYFKGKLLLEKPAENILKWKDINQPFFFCWANHPWIRSWEGKKEIIMPLEYGNEEDWEQHFQYLLPFFHDSRYEKINNKPMFCIFKSDFLAKERMFEFWDKRCKEEGFAGIYLIETFSGELPFSSFAEKLSSKTERVVFREPSIQTFLWKNNHNSVIDRGFRKIMRALRSHEVYRKPEVYSGRKLMEQKIIHCENNDLEIPCIWFEWDNTPRHKQRGYVILPYEKELFFQYMEKVKHKDYLFVNAWNEWAEGMILEPTEKERYRYLEWIKEWKDSLVSR